VIQAFERGGRATVNFEQYDFDFLPYLEQPLVEVRSQFGVDPKGAIVRGPDDLWCGDMGIVGMRKSPDMVERKLSWFEKLLAGKNTESELST
jgi:hypothetical protein